MAVKSHLSPNSSRNFFTKLFLGVLLTTIAVYIHHYLPLKYLQVIPSSSANIWLYGDKDHQGNSIASWINKDQVAWSCEIADDGNEHHVCGLGLSLGGGIGSTGLDLSVYDRIQFELEYHGSDERVRLYTRNYIHGFSDLHDIEKSQFNNLLVPVSELNKPITISLSKFFVAEWWISSNKAPLDFMYPKFNNAVVLGIDLHYPTTPGRQVYRLKNISFIGQWVSAEHWYLCILFFWMVTFVIAGLINWWKLRRQYQSEHLQLEELITSKSYLESQTKHYRQLSLVDQLTGLMSRHGLSEFIDFHFAREHNEPAALIVCDIDFFKKINDLYGHDAGDIILQKVALIIQTEINTNHTAARWGGEEFVIILPKTPLDTAIMIAENIRQSAENARIPEIPTAHITISFGVGIRQHHEPFHKLFRRVDMALYLAKQSGRNRAVIASENNTAF